MNFNYKILTHEISVIGKASTAIKRTGTECIKCKTEPVPNERKEK